MNKIKIKNLLKFLNLNLILSYFFIHNIPLVLIGIVISLYLINNELVNNFTRSIKKNFKITKGTRETIQNDKLRKDDSIQIKLTKEDTTLTLVERIEELGYIPSE